VSKLKDLLKREPVAAGVGALITAAFAYLVTSGLMTEDSANLIAALLALALGVPLTAGIRSQVAPFTPKPAARPRGEE